MHTYIRTYLILSNYEFKTSSSASISSCAGFSSLHLLAFSCSCIIAMSRWHRRHQRMVDWQDHTNHDCTRMDIRKIIVFIFLIETEKFCQEGRWNRSWGEDLNPEGLFRLMNTAVPRNDQAVLDEIARLLAEHNSERALLRRYSYPVWRSEVCLSKWWATTSKRRGRKPATSKCPVDSSYRVQHQSCCHASAA